MKLGATVPRSTIAALERRATKLAALIDVATKASTNRDIRTGGAQLIDRLNEWIEEIKELVDMEDEDVLEMVKSFHLRLRIAEGKVARWQIPANLRKQALGSETKERRRRRPRKQSAA